MRRSSTLWQTLPAAAATSLLVGFAQPANAEQRPPQPLESPRTSGPVQSPGVPTGEPLAPTVSPPARTIKGKQVGSFIVDGGLTVGEHYDDNIFATTSDQRDDFITTISPYLDIQSAWTRHALNFSAGGDFGRYVRHPSENYNDYYVGTDGRLDLAPGSNLFGGISFDHLHESRESPDAVNGVEPTLYNQIQSFLGTQQQFGRWRVRLGGTFERLDFSDVESTTGAINNDDRDRNVYEVGARISRDIAPGVALFAQGAGNWRVYNSAMDDFGFQRDSHGATAAGGVQFSLGQSLEGEAYAGYLWQTYQDMAFGDVRAPDFGGRLRWRPVPSTRVNLYADRSLEETTLFGSPGYLYTVYGIGVEHDLLRDLTLGADASYALANYDQADRTDRLLDVGAGVKYFVTPNLFVAPEYRFFRRTSNIMDARYDDNQIWLRVGAQLADHYNPGAVKPALAGDRGFYVGAQVEQDFLKSNLEGTRGNEGTLDADFGNIGFGGGGFGGYGANIGRWYFGVELDGDDSETQWNHSRVPGGRVFDVSRGPSYGASARLGYWLPEGALVYGRLGVVRTRFDTNYQTASGQQFDQSDQRYGVRVGLGLEAPLVDQMFLRFDYSYTSYADYGVTLPNGTDNFSNTENMFRLGVGYRFHGTPSQDSERPAQLDDYRGFYAGPSVAYSTLNTRNSGPRQSGSTLEAHHGGTGPGGGVVAGVGTLFGRWYLGGEIDAGLSGAGWNQTRDPTGRVYSVDKEWDVAAMLRVGYVLPAGNTLIYGRVGPAVAGFETDYLDEMHRNAVKQDNALAALRYGVGVEVPAGDQWFVRADYTYTKYPGYDVDYVTGVDSFSDSTESKFQVSLMWRF